jgi:hypothetical protein
MTIDVVNTALALNRRPAVTGETGASTAPEPGDAPTGTGTR